MVLNMEKLQQYFQKSSNLFAFISLLVSKTENFNCFFVWYFHNNYIPLQ